MSKESMVEIAKDLIAAGADTHERFTWGFRNADVLSRIVDGDGYVDDMLTWPVFQESLYAGYTSISEMERMELPEDVRELTRDPETPHSPGPLSPEGASGTFVKQALVLHLLKSAFEVDFPALNRVYEVGGGYGAMAVMLRRFGFAGTHTVLDLPAIHLVRERYLDIQGIKTQAHYHPARLDVDLLIAIHSLCEMSIADRIDVLGNISAKYYAFFVTKRYDGINNYNYFVQWCKRRDLVTFLPDGLYSNQQLILAMRS